MKTKGPGIRLPEDRILYRHAESSREPSGVHLPPNCAEFRT